METMEKGCKLMSGNQQRIFVSVRLRPLTGKEILGNEVSDWECVNEDTLVYKNVSLLTSESSMYPPAYTFDRVFGSHCSLREVYDKGAKGVILSALSGINSTVFAYGQTSSGKTCTVAGITEFAIADIYEHVQKHPERDFVVKLSAMEVYNESVRDLLRVSADSTPLRLLDDDPERGCVVENLTEELLRDQSHAARLLSICEVQRQIEDTIFNKKSSNSHQIIRLAIESSSDAFFGRGSAITLGATVNFVDLMGSEKASLLSDGTLKEGCHTDCSLLTLGTIFRKLSNRRNGGDIPHRASKLTRILQTSLGGNARIAIICTMSPARCHVEQSRNTLNFASCAKEATTNAKVNVMVSDKALVMHLRKEVERLQSRLRTNQSSTSSNYSTIQREKDAQIEKLVSEIKDLTLQRDIAQSQVKELLQILGDNASPLPQVGLGDYPRLRVRKSPDSHIQDKETSVLADTHSLDSETGRGHSESTPGDQFVRVPYHSESFESNNASQRMFRTSSYSDGGDSDNFWEGVEDQNEGSLEDICRDICCIEAEENNMGSDHLFSEAYSGLVVKVHANEEVENMESSSSASFKDESIISPPFKDDNRVKEHEASGITPSSYAAEDCSFTSSPDLRGKAEFSTEQEITTKSDYEVASKVNEPPNKNVNDVGVDPVEEESKVATSWPVKFRRIQREIIELWQACNVSLIHRTYFFLLFKGDPSDAIYLELEIRRLRFLKDKFSRGEKTILNGRSLMLSSSKKSLRNERQMLSKQMTKKFSEKERERLFVEWGISLDTKMRRQQLADLVWLKTDDMSHIANSASLIAKLVGIIEPEQSLNAAHLSASGVSTFKRSLQSLSKDMFGPDSTPKNASGGSSFKRNLFSIL